MKKALITGITGQDGSYLAEYLIELGYDVHGIVRRQSVAENQSSRIHNVMNQITTYYGDLMDEHSLYRIMREVQPDEIYNLAAMSHVRVSFDVPSFTIKTNSMGVLNILEAYREEVPEAKFLKKNPRYRYWDGTIHLYSPGTGELYGGLLPHLKEWCKERQYALQYVKNDWYGDVEDEIGEFSRSTRINILQCGSVDNRDDLDGLAALIELCDLVVSTSNVTIHLAGALGKETWVLLPFVSNYWWLLDRKDSIWYPSLSLYRQAQLNDWNEVFRSVQRDLEARFVSQGS